MDLQTRILIVDDDEGIRTLIGDYLSKHGYDTVTAADPIAMRELMAGESFDLIVLDVMMPREDGLTALRQLGSDAPPVIMLSAVGSDVDRIVGLEMGADDYLAKPCNPRELLARIRTVLRRRASDEQREAEARGAVSEAVRDEGSGNCLYFAGWRMDIGLRLLTDPAGQLISLSDGEFRLLRAFAEHPRRVLTRDQLLDWSRGEDSEHYDRAIDVQLSRLRRKLSDGEGGGDIIRTVRNEGYLFVPSVSETSGG
ncbi:response regulator [Novosphingobium sp. 1949]|uniref:Response regulator n=2 Tax=Novosphingobium organovorum TaxID=2930092 RepID=A0ABT0BFD5_9SPHN|nr:response regulator [Novosphingobium organovorum]